MIDNKMEELFETILNSSEYDEYKKIGDILEKDVSINQLINEIKELQQEATFLEYNNDPKYKELDKLIDEKVKELNAKPVYQEYLNKMEEFNEIIKTSSNMLEQYVNEKI